METEPRAETLCSPLVSGSQTCLHIRIMGSFSENMNAWVLPRFLESSLGDSNAQESLRTTTVDLMRGLYIF